MHPSDSAVFPDSRAGSSHSKVIRLPAAPASEMLYKAAYTSRHHMSARCSRISSAAEAAAAGTGSRQQVNIPASSIITGRCMARPS